MGVLGPPWKVPKEFNDITLVEYQFYLVFSTENESSVDTYLKFQYRLPQGHVAKLPCLGYLVYWFS